MTVRGCCRTRGEPGAGRSRRPEKLRPRIIEAVSDALVVIYNAPFCALQIPAEGVGELHLARSLALGFEDIRGGHEDREALCARYGDGDPFLVSEAAHGMAHGSDAQ
jgi:hypothetical protein